MDKSKLTSTNNMIHFLIRTIIFILFLLFIANAENRLIFTDIGLSYSHDISYLKNNGNGLIGDLKIGYTTKKQEADLSLQFSYDFLNGVHRSSFGYDDEDILYGDNTIEKHSDNVYTQEKRVHLQFSICSDIYIDNFFIRISPQFNYSFYSSNDSINTIYSLYEGGSFIPFDTSYQIIKSKNDYSYYPGFLIGIGYKWKRFKIILFDANVVCAGICLNYTLYEIKRKLGAQ